MFFVVKCHLKPASLSYVPDMSSDDNIWAELRMTRIAPAATLLVGTAVLTQVMVLSGIAIIMGVAVVTMCALVVELLMLTAIATVLERNVISLEEIGTLLELIVTVLVTVITVVLASVGHNDAAKSVVLNSSGVTALKLS